LAIEAQSSQPLMVADSMPEFPGGSLAMSLFIQNSVDYPAEARENHQSGKTFVKFIIDTNGKVMNPMVLKSSGFKSLDNEAIRVVASMPDWQPGFDKNKKVSVYINLPITFKNLGLQSRPSDVTPEQQEKHELAMAQWNQGHKLESQGKFENALEKFNKSLDIEPENKYAMFDKAKLQMLLGEKDKACEIWCKMVKLNLRKEEAEEFVEKYCSVENGPSLMATYYKNVKAEQFFASGLQEVKNGRDEAALRRFDSCLKYQPEHKQALFNKASMHYNLQQKKAACASWNKLLAMAPEDKDVIKLLEEKCK
jgi:TonB family protein